jgi:hypothetical protein
MQGLQKAAKDLNKASKEAVSDSLEAEKLIKLEQAKKNVQIQKVNLETAVEAADTILDITA